MMFKQHNLLSGLLLSVVLLCCCGLVNAGEVAGKIVAVRYQKVTINKVVHDKVTVVVDDCLKPGQLTEVFYNPATITDLAVLGHLFDETIQSARTPNMPKQQMYNGHGVFWVDNAGNVKRAGLLGNPIECSKMGPIVQQF